MKPLAACACFVLILFTLTVAPAAAQGLSKRDVVKLGKAATAFVQAKASFRAGSGSAFCIHRSGLFVTNHHVIDGATDIQLVLNSGQADQKVMAAELRYADPAIDLALLQAKTTEELPALRLGSDTDVAELTEVVAFGFPFGDGLSFATAKHPAISINTGSVTSLRLKDDALYRLQLDVALNPGNSGGPVLGLDGKVVGVVVSGVRGAGVNFAIPVSHVVRFVDRVELQFSPPDFNGATVGQPAEFVVRAVAVLEGEGPLDVELDLSVGDEKPRRHKLVRKGSVYRTSVQAFPVATGPPVLHVSAWYGRDSVTGSVSDRPFRVGGEETKLSEIRSITLDKVHANVPPHQVAHDEQLGTG